MSNQDLNQLPGTRLGMVGQAVDIVRSLTLTNVLVLTLLCFLAIPTYMSFMFMNDSNFRREILSYVTVVPAPIPCEVNRYARIGEDEHYTVGSEVYSDGRFEHHLALRGVAPVTPLEMATACEKAIEEARILRDIVEGKRNNSEGK